MNVATKKAALENTLSKIAGFAVGLTVRGNNAFTVSAEGDQHAALKAVVNKIGGKLERESDAGYDADTDFTVVYFTA